MIILKKKGFTLIELLAAIAILAVLTTIAVIGFTKVKDNSLKSNYESKVEYAKVAGLRYGNDNKDAIWALSGHCQTVAMHKLIEDGYLQSDSNDEISYINPVTNKEMKDDLKLNICYLSGKVTLEVIEPK